MCCRARPSWVCRSRTTSRSSWARSAHERILSTGAGVTGSGAPPSRSAPSRRSPTRSTARPGGLADPGQQVRLLIDGTGGLRAMLDVIAGAGRWIHSRTTSFAPTRRPALTRRRCAPGARRAASASCTTAWARRDVRSYWRYLRAAGAVEVRPFRSLPRRRSTWSRTSPATTGSSWSRTGRAQCTRGSASAAMDRRARQGRASLARHGPSRSRARPRRLLDQAFANTWELARGGCRRGPRRRVAPQGACEVTVYRRHEPGRERTHRVIAARAGSISRLWITDAYLVETAPAVPGPARGERGRRGRAAPGAGVECNLPFVWRILSRIGSASCSGAACEIFECGRPMLHERRSWRTPGPGSARELNRRRAWSATGARRPGRRRRTRGRHGSGSSASTWREPASGRPSGGAGPGIAAAPGVLAGIAGRGTPWTPRRTRTTGRARADRCERTANSRRRSAPGSASWPKGVRGVPGSLRPGRRGSQLPDQARKDEVAPERPGPAPDPPRSSWRAASGRPHQKDPHAAPESSR